MTGPAPKKKNFIERIAEHIADPFGNQAPKQPVDSTEERKKRKGDWTGQVNRVPNDAKTYWE